MDESEAILKRQATRIRFKNEDMDFVLNWVLGVGEIVGMAHGEIFHVAGQITDGDPDSWSAAFARQAAFLHQRAEAFEASSAPTAAGQSHLGAAYAHRAALQFESPEAEAFSQTIADMEDAFARGTRLLGVPIRAIEVPFESASLPGYYLEHDAKPRPVLLMVGGGDTFREDLFYFAGYPGWKRGFNVLMVDLPGQGKTPAEGLHFRVGAAEPIGACIDWLASHAATPDDRLAIYGVSGGGYFTAQAVAADRRIRAWIASTPITDMAILFRREFAAAMRAPGWILRLAMKIAGSLNQAAGVNLQKYAWQFGTEDFKAAVQGVLEQAVVVDDSDIRCPALFLMGAGEAGELKRQTRALYEALRDRGQDVTLREFTGSDGADAHCQVNNLRLAHLVVFDWLERVLGKPEAPASVDPRLLC